MSKAAIIADEKGQLIVSGELNFATIVGLWKQSLPLLTNRSPIDIDLSQVTLSNSAGIALLIEWLKYAKQNNKAITFHGISAQLQSIAAVAGVALSSH